MRNGSNGDVLFLESLHPVETGNTVLEKKRKENSVRSPGSDWILVKQFGQKFKYYMEVEDLPESAKEKLKN